MDESSFSWRSNCKPSHFSPLQLIRISLKEIIPEESSWSMASVGRMTINLRKKISPTKWARLTRNRKKPNNLHYWFEIHEKYSADLEKIKDDDDDDQEEDSSEKNTTSANGSTNATTTKKKSKKERRAEKVGETEEEKERAREGQWLKTQLSEAEDRAKAKRKEIDEESRQKKKQVDEELEQEKENLRAEHGNRLRAVDAKYKTGPSSSPGNEL
jgi:hypothetical protein